MGASCGKAGRAFVRRHPAAPPLTDWVVKFVKQAYLDNSATTAVCKQALDVDSDIRVMETMLRRDTATVEQDFNMGPARQKETEE